MEDCPGLTDTPHPCFSGFLPIKGVKTKVQACLQTANVLAFVATQELREMGELIPEN